MLRRISLLSQQISLLTVKNHHVVLRKPKGLTVSRWEIIMKMMITMRMTSVFILRLCDYVDHVRSSWCVGARVTKSVGYNLCWHSPTSCFPSFVALTVMWRLIHKQRHTPTTGTHGERNKLEQKQKETRGEKRELQRHGGDAGLGKVVFIDLKQNIEKAAYSVKGLISTAWRDLLCFIGKVRCGQSRSNVYTRQNHE